MLVYRGMGWGAFAKAVSHAARSSGAVLFVIGAAGAFGWLMAYLEIPAFMVETLNSMTQDKNIALLLMVLALLIMGTFLDLAPKIIIVTPIFLPVAKAYGVEPMHFGVIMVLAGGIGLITPPIGSVLFVGSAIGRISIAEAMKSIWPFYLAAFIVLLLVTFIPQLSLTLPALWK